MSETNYSPGTLVRARGREWIVLAGGGENTIRVRPLSGSEEDQTVIHIDLEPEPVVDAKFPPPTAGQKAGHDAAILLRDALQLSLRRGAGPFRGFGQIAVQPRAYQLVPLLMALKQETVRLLVADDVGVGKTIEAALIARELLDRGEIDRIAVLCPPHLVDQWVTELEGRFHIRAVPVTAGSAARLERSLPPSESIFTAHPYTVVSLDYIKSERRRDDFFRACPDFVIVDEAHTCAGVGQGRHKRYELLAGLAEKRSRHLVLLTATPHSGDDSAFHKLLGLLDPEFEALAEAAGDERARLREKLASHFVQRRRVDIAEWKEERSLFPRRDTKELTYKLTGAWEKLFHNVLDYCADIVEAAEGDTRRARLDFFGTLALMRCVASSPAAAAQALRTRAHVAGEEAEELLEDRVFDGTGDALTDDDVEPPLADNDPALNDLIAGAERLSDEAGDPKLKLLVGHLGELIKDGFNPVVFCRYIATAHYLGRHLADRFKAVRVDVVTGELTADERKEKVETPEDERRLLIATDCLSEGVNLQHQFDAVVHYDLSWNPTRHEQREGRVDRFGQTSPSVRATLLYGENNPVDGAVLEVILRKAEKIREELGVPVPLPDDGHTLTAALMKAVLLRRKATPQLTLDLSPTPEGAAIEGVWRDAAEKAKKNRTVFAQRRLKPEDVLPEWHKTLSAIGGRDEVRRFTERALSRLGSGLEALGKGYKAPLAPLPDDVRERLEAEGQSGTLRIDFAYPAAPRCRPVERSHPLVSVLAETLVERALAAGPDEAATEPSVLGRVGCWVSPSVKVKTTVALLRLRHQLVTQKKGAKHAMTMLVEEATALAWGPAIVEGDVALALLTPAPLADPPLHVRERTIAQALQQLPSRGAEIDGFAERRAATLLADHRRVREAADARGSYTVRSLLPADVVGLYVLLPVVS